MTSSTRACGSSSPGSSPKRRATRSNDSGAWGDWEGTVQASPLFDNRGVAHKGRRTLIVRHQPIYGPAVLCATSVCGPCVCWEGVSGWVSYGGCRVRQEPTGGLVALCCLCAVRGGTPSGAGCRLSVVVSRSERTIVCGVKGNENAGAARLRHIFPLISLQTLHRSAARYPSPCRHAPPLPSTQRGAFCVPGLQ